MYYSAQVRCRPHRKLEAAYRNIGQSKIHYALHRVAAYDGGLRLDTPSDKALPNDVKQRWRFLFANAGRMQSRGCRLVTLSFKSS